MQIHLKNTSDPQNFHWLNPIETLSVLGSIGGAIASIVSHQIAFAAIPLSLSVAINLVNQRRLLDSVNQNHQTALTQLAQDNIATQAQFEALAQQLVEVRQLTSKLGQNLGELQGYSYVLESHQTTIAQLVQEKVATQGKVETLTQQLERLTANFNQSTSKLQEYDQTLLNHQTTIAQLVQEKVATQGKVETLTQQLEQIERLTTNFSQSTSKLQDYTQSLSSEQTKIANTVNLLQELEICNQDVRINSHAKSYYNRGVIYQNLGSKEAAIWDYTEAMRINPTFAQAYQARAGARAALGDKRGAIEDLREAAKLFFEAEDMANYQIARRDLSHQLDEADSSSKNSTSTEKVEFLFSSTH